MNPIDRTKFNIFLLGDTTVGKTSLVEVLSGMPFSEKKLTTIGVDFIFQNATFNGKKYTFKIYDTAGQERYQSIGDAQLKISDGFLLIFSVDKKVTMERVNNVKSEFFTTEKFATGHNDAGLISDGASRLFFNSNSYQFFLCLDFFKIEYFSFDCI